MSLKSSNRGFHIRMSKLVPETIACGWYPIGVSSDFPSREKPVAVSLWGRKLAVYRDSQAKLVAVSSVCPHAGASLLIGDVEGSNLICPYHRWTFEAGVCTMVPAQPDGKVPVHALLENYPVHEDAGSGLVWVYVGTTLADDNKPPAAPFFADKQFRCVAGQTLWQVPLPLVAENLMDVAHVHATHAFGDPRYGSVAPYEVVRGVWGGSAKVEYKLSETGALFMPGDRATKNGLTPIEVTMFFPGAILVRFQSGQYQLAVFTALTPETDSTTRLRYFFFRNYFNKGPEPYLKVVDLLASLNIGRILKEDQRVVETIETDGQLPRLVLRSDAFPAFYRELWRKNGLNDVESGSCLAASGMQPLPSLMRDRNPAYGRFCVRSFR